jgi:hypothetical protein
VLVSECALPVRQIGDYFVFRLGLAGKLRRPLPGAFIAAWVRLCIGIAVLGLPLIWLGFINLVAPTRLPAPLAAAVTVALTVVTFCAFRRFERTWEDINYHAVGTARQLAGQCVVFHVFLGSRWRPRHAATALSRVREACDWLQSKAGSQGVSLEMQCGDELILGRSAAHDEQLTTAETYAPYDRDRDLLRLAVEARRPDWTREASGALARLRLDPDNVCLIVHVMCPPSVGFALPAANDLVLTPDIETCVCGSGSTPAVYAHELLHLFGAPDLYVHPWTVLTDTTTADEWSRMLLLRYVRSASELLHAQFTNSIMCRVEPGLPRLNVDVITARAVGWQKPDQSYDAAAEAREAVTLAAMNYALDEDETRGLRIK